MYKSVSVAGALLAGMLVAAPAIAAEEGAAQKSADKPIKVAALKTPALKSEVTATKPASKAAPKKAKKKKRLPERLVAKVDLSSQRLTVTVDGRVRHRWKISSGAKGFHTPRGSYKPYYITSMHYSKKYDNAPMPHSVFFRGGYAIHATGSVRRLGSPASHGCIRLSPGNARKFFKLVTKYKKAGTRIRITGTTPATKARKRYAGNRSRRVRRNDSWSSYRSYGDSYSSVRDRRSTNTRRIRLRRADQRNRTYRNRSRSVNSWNF